MEVEVVETTPEPHSEDTTVKEVLIKGAVIPLMGLIVTQVTPYLVKKVAAKVKARREAKNTENTEE